MPRYPTAPSWRLYVLLSLLVAGCAAAGHPRDADLESRLRQHRSQLEELARMVSEDSKTATLPFTIWSAGDLETQQSFARGLSREREERYREQLGATGVSELTRVERSSECIRFSISTRARFLSGSTKGLAFCSAVPPNVVASLDSAPTDLPELTPVFKRIDGGWYLFYEWHD